MIAIWRRYPVRGVQSLQRIPPRELGCVRFPTAPTAPQRDVARLPRLHEHGTGGEQGGRGSHCRRRRRLAYPGPVSPGEIHNVVVVRTHTHEHCIHAYPTSNRSNSCATCVEKSHGCTTIASTRKCTLKQQCKWATLHTTTCTTYAPRRATYTHRRAHPGSRNPSPPAALRFETPVP